MRILVVGALGYVGQAVLKELDDQGRDFRSSDIGWFLDAVTSDAGARYTDFGNFQHLSVAELEEFDAIIHLAGYSNDPLGWLCEGDTMALNYHSAVKLAEKARAAGVKRFVFSSTCSVYGASGADVVDEQGPTDPLTPYAASKLATEKALWKLASSQYQVSILRGATAFGPSAAPRTDLLLNEACAMAVLGQPLQLTSNGESWRPFMPVGDFARALIEAAVKAPQSGADYNIWNIAPARMRMTVAEAATRVSKVAGVDLPQLSNKAVVDKRSYAVDGTRFLRDFPDFTYSEDFDAVLRANLDCFAAIEGLSESLADDRFVRLAQLKKQSLAIAV